MNGKEIAAPMPSAAVELPATEADRRSDVGWFDRLKFECVRTFLWGWARTFSLTGLYKFGIFVGSIEYWVHHGRRARFNKQLQRIFGDELTRAKARKYGLRYFRRTRCDKLFYLIFDKLPKEKILRRIRFHDKHVIDDALDRGKGVYVGLSHHGSQHVAGLLMALQGYRCAGVRDRNEGALRRYVQEKYFQKFPELRDIKVFFADSFPRDLYRCLQEGRILASALDIDRQRDSKLRTETVTIYGQQRQFLTGTLQIAFRVGSPIIQGFVVSRKNFYYRLVVMPPLWMPEEGGDENEVITKAMQRYADNIEAHVRKNPDHISKV